ncbi:hypothetical protein KFU94_23090 [Chloroflexi bacterium TSY]|nr:hypothetical protein [Chloroflexi bacterium TSY]
MSNIKQFQVNIGFGEAPSVYINLYDENQQVGRIDVSDPAAYTQVALAIEMLRVGNSVSWHEDAEVLSFGALCTDVYG